MATYGTQTVTSSGVELTHNAVASSDQALNPDGDVMFTVTNNSGGLLTVTITPTQTVDGLAVAAREIEVPDGESRTFGPFDPAIYNDGSNYITLEYDATTSVTAAVFKPG